MTILMENEQELDLGFDYEKVLKLVIEKALEQEKCPYECEVNVTIVDNNTIHEINREQRKIDRPTDVLSFPMLDYEVAGDFSMAEDDISNFNPDSGELILGDIVISYDKVIEQAAEYNHSRKRELAFLVAHSMLHLFGFDHMVDDERIEMEEKQNIILNNLGITREN